MNNFKKMAYKCNMKRAEYQTIISLSTHFQMIINSCLRRLSSSYNYNSRNKALSRTFLIFKHIHTMSGKKYFIFLASLQPPAQTQTNATQEDYSKERSVAIQAVLSASKVCQSVFQHLVANETLTKNDKSPVTGKVSLSEYIL